MAIIVLHHFQRPPPPFDADELKQWHGTNANSGVELYLALRLFDEQDDMKTWKMSEGQYCLRLGFGLQKVYTRIKQVKRDVAHHQRYC